MPSREWKKGNLRQPWYIGDTINIGIGQGFWTATPIQLLMATSALVNKGKVVEPRLVTGTTYKGQYRDSAVKYREPIEISDEGHWDTILDAMYETVKDGTAQSAFAGSVYSSAGKTGTAQLFSLGADEKYDEEKVALRKRDNAMYVGFAPYENPTIVIAVAVENAGGGSANAAPVAREMLDLYFALGLSGKREISQATVIEEESHGSD